MDGPHYTTIGLLLLAAVGYLNWSSSGSGGGSQIRIPIPWLQPKMSFVARNGTRFVDSETGSLVYVNGWNSYWMISSDSPELVKEMMRRGKAMGMTVCRTWAFNDGGPNALQISPGVFDERIFQVRGFWWICWVFWVEIFGEFGGFLSGERTVVFFYFDRNSAFWGCSYFFWFLVFFFNGILA